MVRRSPVRVLLAGVALLPVLVSATSPTHAAEPKDVAARANAALEQYQLALDARSIASSKAIEAQRATLRAQEAADEVRKSFDTYVVMSFQSGGLAGTFSVLESGDSQQLLDQLAMLTEVSESHATLVEDMERAERVRLDATRSAQDSQDAAVAAERLARTAYDKAQALVVEHQRKLAADEAARLAALDEAARKLQEAELATRLRGAEEKARDISGQPSPECPGGDLSGYANGQLPLDALCPLWGTRGHQLRADAAAAFNSMSKAYAEVFGRPICVTDSYRNYAAQVDVKRRKPGLAATPGTSNHGWGRAVDLCGGIERDDTPQNNWLRQNAPRFGWFHPTWADRGGSGRYEPWHWEYAAPG